MLGAGDKAMNKIDKIPALRELTIANETMTV